MSMSPCSSSSSPAPAHAVVKKRMPATSLSHEEATECQARFFTPAEFYQSLLESAVRSLRPQRQAEQQPLNKESSARSFFFPASAAAVAVAAVARHSAKRASTLQTKQTRNHVSFAPWGV